MKIRKAKKGDELYIAELSTQFWKAHKNINDPLLEPFKKLTFKDHIKNAKKSINNKDKNHFFLVAEIEDKVVGAKEFFIKTQDSFFKIRRYGYLDSTSVHEKYRKKGIAKALTNETLKILGKKGIKYVKSNVYIKNKIAMNTWTKLGFKPLYINLFKTIK